MANTTDDNLGDGGTTADGGGGTSGGGGGGTIDVINTIRSGNLKAFLAFFGLGAATVNMLAGENGLLKNPRQFVITVIEDWLFNSLIRPIAESIWNGGVAIVDALAITFFGNDYAIGHPGTTQVGVLDIPFLITGPIGVSSRGLGTVLSEAIMGFNEPIVETISTLGLAAPIVAPAIVVAEIAAAGWVAWLILSSVDIPAIKLVSGLKAAFRPVTNFLGWLLE